MAFDIKKLNAREKNLVGMLIVIVSTLPFLQFTLPAWNTYTESVNKIQEDKNKLSGLEFQIRKLEKLKKENVHLSKKIDRQKLYLAKSYEIDFLVQDLKKICDESSISLESFTPIGQEPVNIIVEKQLEAEAKAKVRKNEKAKQTLEKLKGQELPIDLYRFPIEVKVTGNFTDIIELFKKLEKYGRVISVENISIGKIQIKQSSGNRLSKSKPKKEGGETGTLFGTFDLIAYSLPEAEETLPFNQLQKSLSKSKPQTRSKRR